MKPRFYKGCATALLISIAMIVLTIVLHPMGGSIEYIQKMATIIIISHAIAILAMPLAILGFYGLTRKLEEDHLLSLLGFISSCIGMFAGVCAASINGLALPLYAGRFVNAAPEVLESVKPILKYGFSLNHAFDFVFIGFICIAILLWSVATIYTKALPQWLGWAGIVLVVSVVAVAATGFTFVNLPGFRVFIGGLVCWLIMAAISLRRTQ